MCVTSVLCGPRVDLWPFYGFLCKRFSLCRAKTVLNGRENSFFPYFGTLSDNADVRRCSYFELGLLVFSEGSSVQNFGHIVNCIVCSSLAAARVGRKVPSLKGLSHSPENLVKDFFFKRVSLNSTVILAYSRLYDIKIYRRRLA